jgi:hypothetical protein
MRTEQFLQALSRLNLRPASLRTAEALGLSRRQLQRISAGHTPVSRTLALLVIAYLKHGVPIRLWNPDLSGQDQLIAATARILESMQLQKDRATGRVDDKPTPQDKPQQKPPPVVSPEELLTTARRKKAERDAERITRMMRRRAR